jgi:hypothetical protein
MDQDTAQQLAAAAAQEVEQEDALVPFDKGDPQRFFVQTLKPRHTEIARRLVLGQTPADIAKALGMSPSTINQIKKMPQFKAQLLRLQERRDASVMDVRGQIAEAAPEAVDEVTRLMHKSRDERVRLKAAESLLDRGGFSSINKSEINVRGAVVTANLTLAELQDMALGRLERLKEHEEEQRREVEEGEAIEVEFTDVDSAPSINDEDDARGVTSSGTD